MLEIDGSFGEGGGQILRTSSSLSCLTRTPFRIFNIRKNRSKPGLMPQHLTCVRALALISNAEVKGDSVGSTELFFKPSEPKPGNYSFDIGTAGSTTLLLQAILPPLFLAGGGSTVVLKGGTHVPFSPPFQYIDEIFLTFLGRLGLSAHAVIESYGFYPKGGGKIVVEILSASRIKDINISKRGDIKTITGVSGVMNLPAGIAERQRAAALELLSVHGLNAEINLYQGKDFGQGTFLFLRSESGACAAGFSSLGERGKKAETVGREAAGEFVDYYHTGACLDHHLADQIVLYLAFAEGDSSFTVSRISGHLLTNLRVIEKFTGSSYSVEGEKGNPGRVIISRSHFS